MKSLSFKLALCLSRDYAFSSREKKLYIHQKNLSLILCDKCGLEKYATYVSRLQLTERPRKYPRANQHVNRAYLLSLSSCIIEDVIHMLSKIVHDVKRLSFCLRMNTIHVTGNESYLSRTLIFSNERYLFYKLTSPQLNHGKLSLIFIRIKYYRDETVSDHNSSYHIDNLQFYYRVYFPSAFEY